MIKETSIGKLYFHFPLQHHIFLLNLLRGKFDKEHIETHCTQ